MRLLVLAAPLSASAQTLEAPPVIPLSDSTAAAEAEPLPVLTTAELLGDAGTSPTGLTLYRSLGMSGGFAGQVGLLGSATGRLGVETPSGLRLGGVAVASTFGTASSFAIGPEVSLRRDLGLGLTLRASGQGSVGVSTSTFSYRQNYSSNRLNIGGMVELEREVPILGTVRLAPRVGVYSTVSRLSAVPERGFDARTRNSMGVTLGTDVRFSALGRDASLSFTLPIPMNDGGLSIDGLGQPIGGMSLGIRF